MTFSCIQDLFEFERRIIRADGEESPEVNAYASQWLRIYDDNRLGQRGICLGEFLRQPARGLWALLDAEAGRLDPTGGADYAPLLPAQAEVQEQQRWLLLSDAQQRRAQRLAGAEWWTARHFEKFHRRATS